MKQEEKKLEAELAELAPLLSAYDRGRAPHPQPPPDYWDTVLHRIAPAALSHRQARSSRLAWAAAASVVLIFVAWAATQYGRHRAASDGELTIALAAECLHDELMYLDAEQLEALLPNEEDDRPDMLWDMLLYDLSADEIQDLF